MHTRRIHKLIPVAAALLLAACGADITSGPARRDVVQVVIVPGTRTLTVGDTAAYEGHPLDAGGGVIRDHTISWASSDEAVARVSAAGVVTAVGAGKAWIFASAAGRVGTVSITVMPTPVASVLVSPGAALLTVGQSRQYVAVARDLGGAVLIGRTVTWSTDAPNVVSVSATGLVTALAPGYYGIIATIDGKTGSVAGTVAHQ